MRVVAQLQVVTQLQQQVDLSINVALDFFARSKEAMEFSSFGAQGNYTRTLIP